MTHKKPSASKRTYCLICDAETFRQTHDQWRRTCGYCETHIAVSLPPRIVLKPFVDKITKRTAA